jgi:two-component system phosphate regulon sensor histidine kinase PhoR
VIDRWAWLTIPAGILLGTLLGITSQGWSAPAAAFLALAIAGCAAAAVAAVAKSWLGRRHAAMTAVARRLGFGTARPDEYPQIADRIARRVGRGEALARDLQHLLENMADGVVVLDGDDHVVVINAAAIRIFGIDRDESSGLSLARLARDAEIVELVARVREESITRRQIVRPVLPELILQVVATPVPVGAASRILLILQDVTAIEGQRTAQRDLVANISHDLRTPIAAIKSLCEALLGGAASRPRYRDDFLTRIDSEADRLIGLTESVIAAARADTIGNRMDWQLIDLGELVSDLVARLDPVARRAQVELTVAISEPLAVRADRTKIEIAIANLLLNALKFTPPGKAVRVLGERHRQGAQIRVIDEGCGVDPAIQGRIFERFYKGDPARGVAGAGLGLSIARQFMELHGGGIQVLSAGVGSGSEFVLSVPVQDGTSLTTGKIDGPLNVN